MPSVVTNDIRVQNAKNFVDSVNQPPLPGSNDGLPRAFVFVGKPTPWTPTPERPWISDNRPPVPDNSPGEYYKMFHEILSLKRIRDINCFPMVRRVLWQAGTVYDSYRHDYDDVNLAVSGADNLYDANFYVINQFNDVYVCLNNFGARYGNSNNPGSIDEPISDGNEPFFTSDGYQWMKLYSIKQQILYDYSTNNFIPVTTDGINLDNYERPVGEVLTVQVENRGAGFNLAVGSNGAEDITSYFCKIVGDGEAGVANVRLSGTGGIAQVVDVRVVRPGKDYTFAELDFNPFRVYTSLSDLDKDENGFDPGGDGTFEATVILGPQSGWGRDIPRLLGATRVGVFSQFGTETYDFFADAEFRQIGILHDCEFDPDICGPSPETLSGCYAMTVNDISGTASFIMGETIVQKITDDDGTTRRARGTIVGYDEDERILRYIVVPEIAQDTDGQIYPFERGPLIQGMDSKKTVEVRAFSGSESNLVFVNGFADSEVKHNTGYMTYLGNVPPVQRAETQTERIALIIQY